MRTLVVLGIIVASGILFARLTGARAEPEPSFSIGQKSQEKIAAKVFITASSPVATLELRNAEGTALPFLPNDSGIYSGELAIDPASPAVFIRVVWQEREAGNRFVKLVVEAPEQDTFTHVFDARGDIDDFVELPF